MEVNVYDLLDIYEKEISVNTKNKRKISNFERNKMLNIYDIKNIIEEGNYKVNIYNIFNISRPKYRIVMSLNIKDKIINHYPPHPTLSTGRRPTQPMMKTTVCSPAHASSPMRRPSPSSTGRTTPRAPTTASPLT